ncbi:MAG TPA: hypothetical protein VGK49_02275, partial [Ilumatobacteraceae bacterium]
RPRRDRGDDSRGDRRDRGERRERSARQDRPRRDGAEGGGGDRRERGERPPRGPRPERRERPSFTPPPEVPQRPKPKRLRPGKAHRTEVLASLPEEQRPIAELALQGMAAVRQRLKDDNRKLAAEGKATMPEASVLKLAEDLLPRLRAAEWLDRAEAAKRQLEHLDLRDLRSVVAAADDPMVARDESTRELAAELKAALVTKQERELQLWLGDIEAAIDVGRVIRALRLSSQPPKAGVPFPHDLAVRLVEGAQASLTPADGPDRWAAVLEAAAFSPVHSLIAPATAPENVNDELRATVTRLAPALPKIAALFGIEVRADAPMPKPLRPAPRQRPQQQQQPSARPTAPRDKERKAQRPAPDPAPAAEGESTTPDEDRPAAPDAEPDTGTPPPPDPDRPASPDTAGEEEPPPPDPERHVPLDDEPDDT